MRPARGCSRCPGRCRRTARRAPACVPVSKPFGRETVARSGADDACGVDVEGHLADQRVDRFEALLAAQALEERELERLPVEVAVEVQQVGLDELAAAGDE